MDNKDNALVTQLVSIGYEAADRIQALTAENERLRGIVYLYVDPFDVTSEDEELVQAVVNAVLQEQSK